MWILEQQTRYAEDTLSKVPAGDGEWAGAGEKEMSWMSPIHLTNLILMQQSLQSLYDFLSMLLVLVVPHCTWDDN